ncbi:hypothetical protein H9660_05710 [Clostridium sp. Sa3CUN1]|uniref:Uncharacterized protein n=1 Tax=Clostridium gallinarum TaxID=2762246 RepID=A0ABR8Q2J1_9CLOT|nr:hypothetical protein [Clostridium gallinarum]MBD7914636.1 hypothetical protein [Clostridium gallinarum]
MRKKLISIAILVIIVLIATTDNVYANTPINPINNVYKEGIYKLNKNDTGEYQLQFQFINKDIDSAIIVLDENADILYKNINCNRKCNAGIITNKDTIVIITDGEVELSFTKIN